MEKGVKVTKSKVAKVSSNDKAILSNLFQNREGLRAITISKLTTIKGRTLYRRLNSLQSKGLVENTYPIWRIVNGKVDFIQSLLKSDEIFELHNLSYVVKLIKKPDWWSKRKNRLMRIKGFQFKNIDFGKGAKNPYQQLINENFVIQTYPESLIIMARKRYYSNNPYEVIQDAMSDVLDLLEWFSERIRFNLFAEGIPNIELRGNHFNRLKDHLANHYKKEGRRFLIELDKNRKVWIDYSEPFGKEANYPEGQEILEKVTKDYLLNKPLLNSELQKIVSQTAIQINQVTQNQLMFNKNFESHVEVIRILGKKVEELSEVIKELKK